MPAHFSLKKYNHIPYIHVYNHIDYEEDIYFADLRRFPLTIEESKQ